MVEVLPILGKATTAVQPSDGAFDDPAFWQHDEPLGSVATPDDFNCEVRHNGCQTIMEHRTRIGAVGKQFLEEWVLSEQRGQDHDAAIAILHLSGGDYGMQQQAKRIDHNVPFLAFDQLSSIESIRIDVAPPFSALFTL
jgi:hypothetical protein